MKLLQKKIFALLLVAMLVLGLFLPTVFNKTAFSLEEKVNFYSVNHTLTDTSIDITMKIENKSSTVFKDLKYDATLYYEDGSSIINVLDIFTETFEIGQYSLINKMFSIPLNENKPKGTYFVIINLKNSSSLNLDKKYIDLGELEGTEGFIGIVQESIKVFVDQKEFSPQEGPTVSENSDVQTKVKLKSTFNNDVKIIPKLKVYQRAISYNPIPKLEADLEEISILANEEKEVSLSLPVLKVPESYENHIEFFNKEGNQAFGVIQVRYVTAGVSAKIISYKTSYNKGVLNLEATVIGPADATTIQDINFEATVLDNKTGNQLYKKTTNIDELGDRLQTVLLEEPFSYNAEEIKVIYSIIKDDKVLDVKEQFYTIFEITPKPLFTDIEDYPFKDSIIKLAEDKILTGYSDGTFKPLNEITRAEFSVIMCYLLGKQEEAKNATIGDTFPDLDNSHWAKGFIGTLHKYGYIKGYPDKKFMPSNKITYAEAIIVISNILNKGELLPLGKTWYESHINFANQKGILYGIDVKPFSHIIRGEVAKMAYAAYILLSE